jgi:pimeloyl-ACP methyl ester carboxylesterase
MIDSESGLIDYDECGKGPTVVLVPGSCSTGAAWRPIIAQWENGFRCVTTSLLGYGRTAERRTAPDADISHEAEMLEAVIRRASCPVHLVGHSFGGLVALAVALRNRVKLLSLVIIEAPAVGLLRSLGKHQHYRAFREMTDRYFAAFHAGEEAAIASMIDFYGGGDVRRLAAAGSQLCRRDDGGQHPRLGERLRVPAEFRVAREARRADPRLAGRGEPSGGAARERAPGPAHAKSLGRHARGRGAFHDLHPCRRGGMDDRPSRRLRGTDEHIGGRWIFAAPRTGACARAMGELDRVHRNKER